MLERKLVTEPAGRRARTAHARAITATAALLLLLIAVSAAVPAPGPRTHPLDALGWMKGCWAGVLGSGSLYEEVWMAPRGGVMIGMSRVSRDDRVLGWEFLRIEEEAGTAIYYAAPGGRPPTPFRAVRVEAGNAVFENAGHDYPQRILYSQPDPDSLRARIEGIRAGEHRAVDFPLARVPCPG